MMPGVGQTTPGVLSFKRDSQLYQLLHFLLSILLGIVHTLLQIDISHIFVVDVNLLAFIAVFVDHLFVHHYFFDELIEYVGIQLLYIGVFADECQILFEIVMGVFGKMKM